MKEIRNAKIGTTFLGIEDHGIMTFYIGLDYGGVSQSAGGYYMDNPTGMNLIYKILRLLNVESWEQLKNTPLRVESDGQKVYRLGHLLEDKWLDFEEHFKK